MVHILDFGLAWLKQDPHDERLDGYKAMEFTPHAGAGTPGYMAPEQILHEMHHVCGATDLYAIGCILYKLYRRHGVHRRPEGAVETARLRGHSGAEAGVRGPAGPGRFRASPSGQGSLASLRVRRGGSQRVGALAPNADAAKRLAFPELPRSRSRRLNTRQSGPHRGPPDLDARRESSGSARIRQSPLVGRHDVVSVLREVCDDVIEEVGDPHRFVILVGPAGVGKSRLAEWLCDHPRTRHMIPLTRATDAAQPVGRHGRRRDPVLQLRTSQPRDHGKVAHFALGSADDKNGGPG